VCKSKNPETVDVKYMCGDSVSSFVITGSCGHILNMDDVAQTLAVYNKELVSVDFWKTYSLTPIGVKALHKCRKLEEVDLGWW
jgi:hypothetical protein